MDPQFGWLLCYNYTVLFFLDKYSIAKTGHRGTLRMFVLTAGMSHNRKIEAKKSEYQMM